MFLFQMNTLYFSDNLHVILKRAMTSTLPYNYIISQDTICRTVPLNAVLPYCVRRGGGARICSYSNIVSFCWCTCVRGVLCAMA